MFPSDRNQSVDLLSKSIDWFLYDENIGRERVKHYLQHRRRDTVNLLCSGLQNLKQGEFSLK